MTNEFETQQRRGGGFARTVAKKALAPLVTTAASAGTAFLIRKANEVWQQKLQPKVQEKGGSRAAARELLETAAGKVGGRGSEALKGLAARVGADRPASKRAAPSSASDERRDADRRQREQRRRQRRRSLEHTGSS